jgi:1,4-alpha-glucan branching enzyme
VGAARRSGAGRHPGSAVLERGLRRRDTGSAVRRRLLDRHRGRYRFEITSGADVFETLDAASRDVFSSQLTRSDPTSLNASEITATEQFTWAPFDTPRFENFIVYELHVGTFAGCNDGLNTSWARFI